MVHSRRKSGICCIFIAVLFLLPRFAGAFQEGNGSLENRVSSGESGLAPERVVSLVDEACRLVEKDGEAGMEALMTPNGRFRFGDTYVWVHDIEENRMLAHPTVPRDAAVNLIYLRDITGKLCFAEFNQVAIERGSGWVEYYWPRPGEIASVLKTTYVKLCRNSGKRYVVACGIYGVAKKDVRRHFEGREEGKKEPFASLKRRP